MAVSRSEREISNVSFLSAANGNSSRYFEKLGYEVQIVNVLGPDLIIKKNGVTETVEVKTATQSKEYARRSFAVAPVSYLRKKDDLIAYVFMDKVAVITMKEHLDLTPPSGHRNVSQYFVDPLDIQNKRVSKKTGYKGVTTRKNGKYFAYIKGKGKQITIGYYLNVIDAAKAYDKVAKSMYGNFAYLNFPEE